MVLVNKYDKRNIFMTTAINLHKITELRKLASEDI